MQVICLEESDSCGAGIAGLAAAYYLRKLGGRPTVDYLLLEQEERTKILTEEWEAL